MYGLPVPIHCSNSFVAHEEKSAHRHGLPVLTCVLTDRNTVSTRAADAQL